MTDSIFPGGQTPEEALVHDVDPRKEATSDTGIPEEVAEVADRPLRVEADIPKGAVAPEGERNLAPACRMGGHELRQRKVGEDVAVIDEDRLVIFQKILDVLEPAGRVEKDRLVAKEDRHPLPAPAGKGLDVGFGAVVGVDDEPFDADRSAVVHRIGDERAAADRQQRLGKILRQRAEARSQPRPENKGRPDYRLFHVTIISFFT